MSRIHCEYDLVERPLCKQIKTVGWQWINNDESGLITDLLTGRVRVPASLDFKTKYK